MRKLSFSYYVLLSVLVTITGCDIFSSNSELSQTERMLIGDPWELSSYEVQNGPTGDGFGVTQEFHFLEDNKMKSLVSGNERTSKWVFQEDERLIIIYQKFPWEEKVIEIKVDKVTNIQLTLSFRNFGYDVIAQFSRE
ncbi:hypothetical protein [Gracilimonas sp.]|uniref:hypothetical protein n=1 Tax=Gracilimonas sp. TaxID=1974203 RepID=UPI0028717F36|nr:hypothetical protein [Gracilimonas sp.]